MKQVSQSYLQNVEKPLKEAARSKYGISFLKKKKKNMLVTL